MDDASSPKQQEFDNIKKKIHVEDSDEIKGYYRYFTNEFHDPNQYSGFEYIGNGSYRTKKVF
jgi:hypothetical protein